MTLRWLLSTVSCVLMTSLLLACKKQEKVEVTEQRELTMYDEHQDPIIAVMPPEWRQIPATKFRMFNYRFGKDGEAFVGSSRGDVLANVNRWLGQFGQEALMSVDDLEKVEVLGQEGVLVTASGRFGGGMGRPAREDAGLAGIIVQIGDRLFTVKMIGDKDAVEAERERLIQFAKNLRIKEASSSETTK